MSYASFSHSHYNIRGVSGRGRDSKWDAVIPSLPRWVAPPFMALVRASMPSASAMNGGATHREKWPSSKVKKHNHIRISCSLTFASTMTFSGQLQADQRSWKH